MTSAVVSNAAEIRELTVEELDEAGGGLPAWAIVAGFVISPIGMAAFCLGAGIAAVATA